MSKISELIKKDIQQNPHLENEYQRQNIKFEVAVSVMKLRESHEMTQREFAVLVGKNQSEIARIENGNANVTLKTLDEIAEKSGKKLKISFV